MRPPICAIMRWLLAGNLLEMGGAAQDGDGLDLAAHILSSGRAWDKFQAICEAQGGMRTPPRRRAIAMSWWPTAPACIDRIDNRRLSKVAKLAGAPDDPAAGVEIHVRIGDRIVEGEPTYTIHSEAPGELAYALNYALANLDIVGIAIAMSAMLFALPGNDDMTAQLAAALAADVGTAGCSPLSR